MARRTVAGQPARRSDRDSRTGGRGFVEEDEGFLAAEDAARIYAILQNVRIPSSVFYLSLEALEAPQTSSLLAHYLPEALGAFIVAHLRRLLRAVPDDIEGADGFELWTTRPKRSETGQIYLHVDCDEQLRTGAGVICTPMLGSVLYLGPQEGLVGGETLFVTEERLSDQFPCFKFHHWEGLAAQADSVRVVEPRPGKLVLFSGDTPHGQAPVVDHPDGLPRIALLANLWSARIGHVPAGICALSPEEFRRRASV